VAKLLGPQMIEFFQRMVTEHGRVDPILFDGIIPHPVHLREGMTVRNSMRQIEECNDWTAHDLDDSWTDVVRKIMELHIPIEDLYGS
jgi:hypothetical protein